jgi:hypothetical protein
MGTSRRDGSSAPEKRPLTKDESMKKEAPKPLTSEQVAELNALAALSDDMIDTSDAPEVLDWSLAKRGLFYRPLKQASRSSRS